MLYIVYKQYWNCNIAYLIFFKTYFLEYISSTATLKISSINKVYVCMESTLCYFLKKNTRTETVAFTGKT